MKFTNGTWLPEEGYSIFSPKEIFEVERSESALNLYAPYTSQTDRSRTVDSGMMTIRISSPATNIISVKIINHKGAKPRDAAFRLNTRSVTPVFAETEDEYVFVSGSTEARIPKSGAFSIRFLFNGRILTSTGLTGPAYITDPDGQGYVRERLELDVGEYIYGLGERFTPFVRNGQSVEIWNEDGGTDSDLAYKNIPFFLSSRSYGVFVNHTGKVSYEVGSECPSKTQFSVAGECLEYFILGGESNKHILTRYAELVGRPSLPPSWSFGLWLSTSFVTDYREETVLDFVEGMIERKIPISVFHFDCFWMKGFEWTSFLWDQERFPNPAGMIRKLHDRGIRVCLWINPYIAQKSPIFQEGLDGGYFVTTGSGDIWQWDRWQAGMALVDFSNPVARGWYQKHLDDLIRMGVDSFKTDFGERIPVADSFYGAKAKKEDIVYHNGLSARSMHNTYAFLYQEAVFEVLEKRLGKNNACIFARAGSVGCQQFPVHWGGDCPSTYQGMAQSLRGGLSLGVSGFGFWSHDIGGFEDGCDPDLYMRWLQFGLLSSHSRLHGSGQYKVPWMYGEEAVEVASHFTRLKLGLMPYLFSAAVEATTLGLPVLRPMFLEFPSDESCRTLDRQYMLGPSLLCAPIFNDLGTVRYYVPKGIWTNIMTRDRIEGPCWRNEKHDYFTMPILARENTILVTGGTDDTTEYDYLDSVTITVFELKNDRPVSVDLLSSDTRQSGVVRATRKDKTIVVETEGIKGTCRLMLTNVFRIKVASQGVPEINEWGTLFTFNGGKIHIELL
ncbi:MAG: alpha-xylosidase [Clostridiales bacterium]|nr:alpha-xylosidase [Clostridiales bacterium]